MCFLSPHRKCSFFRNPHPILKSKSPEKFDPYAVLSPFQAVSIWLFKPIHCLLTTLLPETQLGGWIWCWELRSWWNCWLHCYNSSPGLLERYNRYTSSVGHWSIGRYAFLQRLVQVSHSGSLLFLIAVVAGHNDAEYQQDDWYDFQSSHSSKRVVL